MKVKDEAGWKKANDSNTDPYGNACIRYAERWADLMEEKMVNGQAIADMAKETSHEADTDGITGFMYGCAVSVLAGAWEYGDELRRWHNLDTQIKDEGAKANESGGVLNPAIVDIET